MTASTARVFVLLEILQAGGVRTVGELAVRLQVDERTVRRSVAQLIDLGIPVTSLRGRYGGYQLAPGYRMPPLMLTDNEALAVLLGLVLGGRTTLFREADVASESAAAKIRRVLPDKVGRRLGALLDNAEIVTPATATVGADVAVLLDIAEAARDQRPLMIGYRDRNGTPTDRTVHPYGVVAHAQRWYLTGVDSARGEMRTFRLDRITTLTKLSGSFDVPRGFDPRAAVIASLEDTPWAHDVSVRIHSTIEQVRRHFPTGIAALTEPPEQPGWIQLTLRAEHLDWVASTLAAVDKPFVINHPAALRDHVHALADRLHRAAEPESDT